MPAGVIVHSVLGLAAVGLTLLRLYAIPRMWSKAARRRPDEALVRILQTTMLSPQAALHVVQIAERCYLIGSGAGHVSLIAELSNRSSAAISTVRST